ncbi:MAG TPA: SurA N-terminal domain-containing protein [Planococcus sp. (in: firmicutes)]|nr:SurA N-terminal domain-containing protein [Planococcus sp. (in: firmicutes)]
MIKKWFLSLSLGVSVIVLAACGGADESAGTEEPAAQEEAAGGTEEGAEQPAMPEPDLEGIPEVVAEVNGEEILKEEFEVSYSGQFQQAAMQSQMSGQEVDQDELKAQVAESMVGQKLLIQEADNRDFEASQEEIDEEVTLLAEQNGLESKEQFLEALEEQGMTEEEVMAQLETQVKVNQLIAAETGNTEVTDEELQELYEQIQAQQEQSESAEELPSFEDLKPELEEQVKMQKENEAAQTLIADLRENGDVTINL